MLLGKRPRPPMKRTTSMSEITLDLNTNSDGAPPPQLMISDSTTHQNNPTNTHRHPTNASCGGGGASQSQSQSQRRGGGGGGGGLDGLSQQFLQPTTMVSPRNHRRNSVDSVDTAHFLRACSLCKRRLFPGRDIYMYRGDSAFCSLECRQQQMNLDERMEKCSLASKKDVTGVSSTTTGPQVSTKGETVVAL
ncbi:FCS-Like Zinc finger 5-like [Quercus robur]|uniref:FCS-Like Zinc finger 5-like n=1 Tax=Quercus robur TaxID=38942 RepID=UPI0021639414|nr:FCS-Like Zinc finger 5-like [Quercus robur]